jgi:hypothetical protein
LRDWRDVGLELVAIPDRDTGEPSKYVWRGVASR